MDTQLKYKHYASLKRRSQTKKVVIYTVLVLMSVIWLLPFVYLISQSFATTYVYGDFFPKTATMANYSRLFTDSTFPFWRWWLNTFLISCITAVLQTLLTLATAYAPV